MRGILDAYSIMANKTVLYELHTQLGGRMVDFAGWELPVMYTSIIEEHLAVRNNAGLFDVSHMGKFLISGSDALAFLNYTLTNDFSKLKNNRSKYSLICLETGVCIDDLIVYKLVDDKFFIIPNASNAVRVLARFIEVVAQKKFNVSILDLSGEYSLLALQGINTFQVLKTAFSRDFLELDKFSFLDAGDFHISRTGYTGSDGVEILVKNHLARALAEKLIASGAKPCGLGSRDSLRLEAQYPLYGHEISEEINPYESGLGWAVKLDKDFSGRDALKKILDSPLDRCVKFFQVLDRRTLRAGADIYCDNELAGRVLSGVWSPTLNAPIGSCLIKNEYLSKELFAKVRESLIKVQFKNKFL